MSEYVKFYPSPAGRLTMVTDSKCLNALLLQKETEGMELQETASGIPEEAERIFSLAESWLEDYFAGRKCENPRLISEKKERRLSQKTYELKTGKGNLSLCPKGSEFRQEVWKKLCEIPYGETVTYGEIARHMAALREKKKMSAQAVGGAVGHNPISIMIPCHRVVGAGGNLVGYGGGLQMKTQLLELEGIALR